MSGEAAGPRRYALRPVGIRDRACLARWRAMPHVREWWGEPGEDMPDDPRVARRIASVEGKPFAYVQDYDVHGWAGHHFGHLPPGSRGVDLYIGEPSMLGLGHGPALARQHVEALLGAGAPAVAVDPHPANARAIAAWRRAGFVPEGRALETDWGPALPMVARAR